MPGRRTAKKKALPEPVESTREFTGLKPRTFYGCPICGRSGEDKGLIERHIEDHPEDERPEGGEQE